MAEILLFHHAQGSTSGCHAFAETLRGAGHIVHAPDLYDGETFTDLDEGVGHARKVGFDVILERGRAAAETLPPELVYIGFSLGIMAAQMLAQTRRGAKGAVLLHGSAPLSEFGGRWSEGVPLQIHTMEDDDWGDVDVARDLVKTIDTAELFTYPGDGHLFTDESLAAYDDSAAELVKERVLGFLSTIS